MSPSIKVISTRVIPDLNSDGIGRGLNVSAISDPASEVVLSPTRIYGAIIVPMDRSVGFKCDIVRIALKLVGKWPRFVIRNDESITKVLTVRIAATITARVVTHNERGLDTLEKSE